jgi:hypothetical protein
VHDLGYIGKPNMDGPEGETHPVLRRSNVMSLLFGGRWGTFGHCAPALALLREDAEDAAVAALHGRQAGDRVDARHGSTCRWCAPRVKFRNTWRTRNTGWSRQSRKISEDVILIGPMTTQLRLTARGTALVRNIDERHSVFVDFLTEGRYSRLVLEPTESSTASLLPGDVEITLGRGARLEITA